MSKQCDTESGAVIGVLMSSVVVESGDDAVSQTPYHNHQTGSVSARREYGCRRGDDRARQCAMLKCGHRLYAKFVRFCFLIQ